ncbi:GlxA family transcriptional regulator [Tahibacter amnicola]|uniref:Helix-turn-helix domain-containing protein n=1 Tax=Tahibacter amnicola TaxID=2976241 RepID=A0ABY6BAJ1_9GAMM|nr:helix-turn-helix domain-containing protein [Tahibacter amnicola]UXI66547.1 helix-turn-helix domain-containing protein [Tahibacter amnicola]
MRLAVLALDGVFDTGLATVLDAFTTANELAQMHEIPAPALSLQVIALRPVVRSALGLQVPVVPIDACERPDWVVVPAIGYKMPEALVAALGRDDLVEAYAALQRWSAAGVRVAAACIGTFVLAESGLLDDKEATTTWWLTPLFRQRYPRVRLDAKRMLVASDGVLTAGAALSHMDMALWLIRQHSPALASVVAKYLVVDSRPSQSAYVISDHLARANPLVEQFDRWARNNLDRPFNLDAAAAALATSKRTLARRLDDVLGKSPTEYVQDLRIERAVHLLKTSNSSVDQIAAQVGYADGVTLRTLMRKRLGMGIRELRRA